MLYKMLAMICVAVAAIFDAMRDSYVWDRPVKPAITKDWHSTKLFSLLFYVLTGIAIAQLGMNIGTILLMIAAGMLDLVVFELIFSKGFENTIIYFLDIPIPLSKTKTKILFPILLAFVAALILIA